MKITKIGKSSFVGRVERSETRQDSHNQYMSGFASLYPTYNIGIERAKA